MKGILSKTAMVGSKVLEILHWVLAVSLIAVIILCAVYPAGVGDFLQSEGEFADFAHLTVGGFGVSVVNAQGNYDVIALMMFSIGAVLMTGLMAMIFRNIYLILRKSRCGTPFVKDNVRMIKEIGIFSIAMPVVGFIMSIITRMVCGVEVAEVSVDFGGLMMGLVMLCLTQCFAYGVMLQEDVDGLL